LFVLCELQEFLMFWRLAIRPLGCGAELGELSEPNAREAESGAAAPRRKAKWGKVMRVCEAP